MPAAHKQGRQKGRQQLHMQQHKAPGEEKGEKVVPVAPLQASPVACACISKSKGCCCSPYSKRPRKNLLAKPQAKVPVQLFYLGCGYRASKGLTLRALRAQYLVEAFQLFPWPLGIGLVKGERWGAVRAQGQPLLVGTFACDLRKQLMPGAHPPAKYLCLLLATCAFYLATQLMPGAHKQPLLLAMQRKGNRGPLLGRYGHKGKSATATYARCASAAKRAGALRAQPLLVAFQRQPLLLAMQRKGTRRGNRGGKRRGKSSINV
jgi:hypothetical protein